jgi:uncharacterized protein YybS (DUF2232 family)
MTCSSFEHNLVIYLMMVAASAIQILSLSKHEDKIFIIATHIDTITQVAHLTLSLLINIFATSIIALKAWCVRIYGVVGKYFVDCALIDDAMCTYKQEIPQVADGKRDRDPNPWTGNQNIGYPG